MTAAPSLPHGREAWPTASSELAQHHSIRIARPYGLVERQIARLDDRWLEDAVRSALQRGYSFEAGDPEENRTSPDFRIRFGRRSSGPEGFVLPIAWEIEGPAGLHAGTGRVDVVAVPAGPDETQVGVRIVADPEASHPGDEEQRRIDHALEVASGCLLSRVFWTLEVLCLSDATSGAGETNPAAAPKRSAR